MVEIRPINDVAVNFPTDDRVDTTWERRRNENTFGEGNCIKIWSDMLDFDWSIFILFYKIDAGSKRKM